MDYKVLARYYDEITEPERRDIERYVNLLLHYHPEAKSVLEVGCGTGQMLRALEGHYELAGLDIAPDMLKIAKKKQPKVAFYEQNMAVFELDRKFDAIICMYDSVNHLTNFENWKTFFRHVADHLNEGGVFLFDMNTMYKFKFMEENSPFVYTFGNHYMVSFVNHFEENMAEWDIKLFEHKGGNRYKLGVERIEELAVESDVVEAELKQHFKEVESFNKEFEDVCEETQRIYFACKK